MNVSEIREYSKTITSHPDAHKSKVGLSRGRFAEYYWEGNEYIIGCVRDSRGGIIEIIKEVKFSL